MKFWKEYEEDRVKRKREEESKDIEGQAQKGTCKRVEGRNWKGLILIGKGSTNLVREVSIPPPRADKSRVTKQE